MAVFAVGRVQRRIYRPVSFHFNIMPVWGCLLVLTCVKCVYLYVVGLTTVEESRHGSEPVGHTRSVRWKGSYCRLSKPTFAMLCLGCPSLPFPPRSCSVQWNTWSPFINSCVCLDEHMDSNQKVCSHYLYLQVSLRKVLLPLQHQLYLPWIQSWIKKWTDMIRFDFLPSHSFSKSQRHNKYTIVSL